MNILITGITGQTASYLAEMVVETGDQVFGLIRTSRNPRLENIKKIKSRITLLEGDLLDEQSLENALKVSRPEAIFHLGAQSYVPAAFNQPVYTFEIDATGTLKLLEAIRKVDLSPRMLFASSSEVYGKVAPEEIPLTETSAVRPSSPYAVAKLASEYLCRQYYMTYGYRIVITRAFNHESPRRGRTFVTQEIVHQGIEIKRNLRSAFALGDITAQRDFSDARDIAEAYLKAIHLCAPGAPYNICSGKVYPIGQIVTMVQEILGTTARVLMDPNKLRPIENPILVGDCSLFKQITGWTPAHTFQQTLKDMVDAAMPEYEAPK